jgi:hypothetical protein
MMISSCPFEPPRPRAEKLWDPEKLYEHLEMTEHESPPWRFKNGGLARQQDCAGFNKILWAIRDWHH